MTMQDPDAPYFIDDGHTVSFGWLRDEVKITSVHCPNEGTASLCTRRRSYCVVRRFLEMFGFETNLGRATIDGPVRIAWTALAGESDLDSEFSQVWVTPVVDPDYLSMLDEEDSSDSPPPPPAP